MPYWSKDCSPGGGSAVGPRRETAFCTQRCELCVGIADLTQGDYICPLLSRNTHRMGSVSITDWTHFHLHPHMPLFPILGYFTGKYGYMHPW